MGLDNYASRNKDCYLTPEDEKAFEEAGLYTDIRGKIYFDLIESVTGIGLHQKWIPPEVVKGMSIILERTDAEKAIKSPGVYREHSKADFEMLQRFFGLCAERGLGLVGSW